MSWWDVNRGGYLICDSYGKKVKSLEFLASSLEFFPFLARGALTLPVAEKSPLAPFLKVGNFRLEIGGCSYLVCIAFTVNFHCLAMSSML